MWPRPHAGAAVCPPVKSVQFWLVENVQISIAANTSNRPSSLITLCRACHARLHRLGAIDRWVPELLGDLWAEQHPGAPRQLQLPGNLLG